MDVLIFSLPHSSAQPSPAQPPPWSRGSQAAAQQQPILHTRTMQAFAHRTRPRQSIRLHTLSDGFSGLLSAPPRLSPHCPAPHPAHPFGLTPPSLRPSLRPSGSGPQVPRLFTRGSGWVPCLDPGPLTPGTNFQCESFFSRGWTRRMHFFLTCATGLEGPMSWSLFSFFLCSKALIDECP